MGFCPKMGCGAMPRPEHLAGQRLRRRPDKCDAGRRPSGRRISRPAASGRTRSLCRSSSSHRNRFAVFRREPCSVGDKSCRFSLLWRFRVRGGITTLGRSFMPLKRRTRRGHGGLFAVFYAASEFALCGRIFPRRLLLPHGAAGAHSVSQGQTGGDFALSVTA